MAGTVGGQSPTAQAAMVMRQYTRGLRIPALVGKMRGGGRFPGGPYTVTQFVGGVSVIVLGALTSRFWACFSPPTNMAVAVVTPVVVVAGLGLIKPGGRSPWATLGGVVTAATRPAWGSVGGSPVRLRPARRMGQRTLVHLPAVPVMQVVGAGAPPVVVERAAVPVTAVVVLTGVQRLLAATAGGVAAVPAEGEAAVAAAWVASTGRSVSDAGVRA